MPSIILWERDLEGEFHPVEIPAEVIQQTEEEEE